MKTLKIPTMKNSRLTALSLIAMMAGTAIASAQDDAPKFKFTPGGRILADGAVFAPREDGKFTDGVALPDIRLCGTATYGNWKGKVDIGYAYGKVGMKDVFIQYTFNPKNLLRGGYFVHQFGAQSATSSSFKVTFEAPITDTYMNATGRNLGLMYLHDGDNFLGTASVIAGTKLTEHENDMRKMSWGGITRLLYRPYHQTGAVAQFGMSAWYQSAFHYKDVPANDGTFSFSADYPTRVDNVTLLESKISNANGVVKLSPEIVLSKSRVALEAQYYYMNVNRGHKNPYTMQGCYGTFRTLLIGDKEYGYSSADGGLATPGPKSLELVLGYNYTNANCDAAGVHAGITNDYSVTLNYYINKYLTARLRYSYTNLFNSRDDANKLIPESHVNIVQARLQFKF